MNYYVGIDPGKTGGWAIVPQDDGAKAFYAPFTTYSDFAEEIKLRQTEGQILLSAIEQVSAMPGQGVSSMFVFGQNYGGWLATLEMLGLSHVLVRPQAWQKAILGAFPKGESKIRALEYAQRRWPDANFKKKDSGVIDALLIAMWGRKYG